MAKILAVDDSRTMRQMVNFALTDAGHEVHEADGYDTAVAQVTATRYDLIISDINMPGKNGLELVRALRTMPNSKFAPILMLTTESQQVLREEGKQAGASGWIVKPFQPEELVDIIAKVLRS